MKSDLVSTRTIFLRGLLGGAIAFAALGANSALAAIKPCSTSTVAFVKSIKGTPANVVLTRGGDQAQLTAFSPLCQGDVLSLKTASEIVTLGIAGSSGPNEISGPTKFTVGAAQTGAESISAVIEDRLLPLGGRTIGQGLGRAADPFEFGLLDLETETTRVKAGNRPLWVGWNGGKAPFVLTILGPTDEAIVTTTVTGHDTVLPATSFPPGHYTISVKDSLERVRQTGFEAVTDVPAVAPVDVPSWMGADSGAMLTSFCLAAVDPYTWSFEAAQELSAAPDTGLDKKMALALIASGDTAALCPGKNG